MNQMETTLKAIVNIYMRPGWNVDVRHSPSTDAFEIYISRLERVTVRELEKAWRSGNDGELACLIRDKIYEPTKAPPKLAAHFRKFGASSLPRAAG